MVTGYFDQESNNLINTHDKKTFFKFLQFIAFSQTQTANTKTFGINPILSFNLKLTILWILFKLTIKVNINENY